MQPTLCARCKKNVAVVFISRMNEKRRAGERGPVPAVRRQAGPAQVEDMMKRMGITPEDLESLSGEMMQGSAAPRSWRICPRMTAAMRMRAARRPPSRF